MPKGTAGRTMGYGGGLALIFLFVVIVVIVLILTDVWVPGQYIGGAWEGAGQWWGESTGGWYPTKYAGELSHQIQKGLGGLLGW